MSDLFEMAKRITLAQAAAYRASPASVELSIERDGITYEVEVLDGGREVRVFCISTQASSLLWGGIANCEAHRKACDAAIDATRDPVYVRGMLRNEAVRALRKLATGGAS